MWDMKLWAARPFWMVRYCLSSWLMSAALRICPGPRYAAELRRRVHGMRDEVIVDVLTRRAREGV